MSYQALYRAWRPKVFADLVGQSHVQQTLSNAIVQHQVAHAYLFCGPRGTGKTSTAKVFAKAVNCEQPQGIEPCNICDACLSISQGSSVDVEEIDAASNRGVDEIRQLREKVHYAPAALRKKVYIVDEVHMLTTEAFNALLKTLEEPPPHAMFVLATTEPHKIPATIVSRCQRFDFRRIAPEQIVERLREVAEAEAWTYTDTALYAIAEAADGGLRDALGHLEQTAAYGQGQVTEAVVAEVSGSVETPKLLELIGYMRDQQLLQVIELLQNWYAAGKDAQRVTHDVLQAMRDLFIVKLQSGKDAPRLARSLPEHEALAVRCPSPWLLTGVHKLGELYMQLRYIDQPRLALEAALLGLASEVAVQPAAAVPSPLTVSAQADGRPTQPVAAPVAAAEAKVQDGEAAAKRRVKPSPLRKREVLQELERRAKPDVLSAVRSTWAQILQMVKEARIQTHAWLMNGEAVLATDDAVVLCFLSRIHRDAVMKPDDRQTIETAIGTQVGRPLQIFALLQADWDEFKQAASTATTTQEVDSSFDIANQVKTIFGEALVEIRYEE